MSSRIRDRIGAIESSLSDFAHNWRTRIRGQSSSNAHTSSTTLDSPNSGTQESSPSSPVSTTTNLDALEITVEPNEQISDTINAQTSIHDSNTVACQTHSRSLSSRHSQPVTVPSTGSSRRSGRRHRSSRHGAYRIGIQDIHDDRNMLAAIISLFVILILASALAQFRWFSLFNESSLCDFGVYFRSEEEFKLFNMDSNSSDDTATFDSNKYMQPYSNSLYSTPQPPPQKVPTNGQGLNGKSQPNADPNSLCDNPEIASMKRSIIILCFIAIKFTLLQLFFDILGTRAYDSKRFFFVLRSHGVGNIVTVITCVLIIAVCYYMGVLTEKLQMEYIMKRFKNYTINKTSISINHSSQPSFGYHSIPLRQVKFEVSYYLVTLAGFFSILAAAANLFRKPKYVLMERIGGHTRTRRIGGGDQATLLNLDSTQFFPFFQPGVGWVGYPPNGAPSLVPGGQTNVPLPGVANQSTVDSYSGGVASGGSTVLTGGSVGYGGYARPDPFGCPPPPPYTP